MQGQRAISAFLLFLIVGCYGFSMAIVVYETNVSNTEFADFPFNGEEEETKDGKEKESEKEYDEDIKEFLHQSTNKLLSTCLKNQKDQLASKNYSCFIKEVLTPPPDNIC